MSGPKPKYRPVFPADFLQLARIEVRLRTAPYLLYSYGSAISIGVVAARMPTYQQLWIPRDDKLLFLVVKFDVGENVGPKETFEWMTFLVVVASPLLRLWIKQ